MLPPRVVYQLGEVVPRWLLGRSSRLRVTAATPVIARHRRYDHRSPGAAAADRPQQSSASANSASSAVTSPVTANDDLLELQTAIADAAGLVGQRDLLDAVLLGLVSREHVFVSGPPGCGKTLVAEAAAATSGR